VCRPALSSLTADIAGMRAAAAELFDLVQRGVLKIAVSRTYPLGDAATAHRDIENRQSLGSMLLLP
jgi:NADPH:quinone reductase